ncbi:MAG: hypothetical protein A2Z97_05800 [Bdellovibrionales bacterium GWB1_52_6]|nr:MAG: hypothetical protein A2Z97_05800 [Bdellovibrionales bacterium GWB1_52_6]OFZ04388.1 MAG: hypothetical protein A2X97_07015 [Bdellovibrionales bacterium GWA1_52_35]
MKSALLLTLVIQLLLASGCAKLGGGLRRDFDDGTIYSQGPTTGGRWTEKGLLDDDQAEQQYPNYAAVGHAERAPAFAQDASQAETQDTWSETANAPAKRVLENRKPQFKNGSRARRADFIDESTNEGSLWAPEGQTNYYFSKNKIRSVGDIITVTLDEQIVKDLATEVKRTLIKQEAQVELGIAQQRLLAQRQGTGTAVETTQGGQARAGAESQNDTVVAKSKDNDELPEATFMDIDLGGALEIKANDTVLAEVVERYPNGNYKIRGTKKVLYKNGAPRLLTVVAIAKGSDISEEDVVNSGKLYEYRLEAVR